MRLELFRISSGNESTLGVLYILVDGQRRMLCFTLEDEFRAVKRYGETRVPPGTYLITLRREGKLHARYSQRFGMSHQGMLWIRGVANFEYIYMHVGNNDEDTAGCILVGDQLGQNVTDEGALMSSRTAYERVYKLIATAIESSEDVSITIQNLDTPPQEN